jgi:hypothetical protein
LGKGSATTWVMDDVLHDSLDEANALAKVEHTELGGTLAGPGVRLEN